MNDPYDPSRFAAAEALHRLWGWKPSNGQMRPVAECSRPTPLNPRPDDGVPSSDIYRRARAV